MSHDERNIPLDYDPQPAKETAWQRVLIALGLSHRNERDETMTRAVLENDAYHEADARRKLRQAGVSEKAVAKAAAMLARVGKGEG